MDYESDASECSDVYELFEEESYMNNFRAEVREVEEFQDPWLTDDKTELLEDIKALIPDEDIKVPDYIVDYRDRLDYLFFSRIGDARSVLEIEEACRPEGLVGGSSDTDEDGSSDDEGDPSEIRVPAKLEDIVVPKPGFRSEEITRLTSCNKELLAACFNMSKKIGEDPTSWQQICHARIKTLVLRAHKKYRSSEKHIYVELYSTNVWLREWARVLKLKYDVSSSNVLDEHLRSKPSKECQRHLDEGSYNIKHAFRGAQTLRDLLVTLFASEPDEVLVAKLGLLATSEDACLKYSRRSIYRSFLQICMAASVTGDELIQFVLRVLPALRQLKSSTMCICGELMPVPSQWKIHGCKLEQWLVYTKIGVSQGPFLKITSLIEWRRVLEQIEPKDCFNCPQVSDSSSDELEYSQSVVTSLEVMMRVSPRKEKGAEGPELPGTSFRDLPEWKRADQNLDTG